MMEDGLGRTLLAVLIGVASFMFLMGFTGLCVTKLVWNEKERAKEAKDSVARRMQHMGLGRAWRRWTEVMRARRMKERGPQLLSCKHCKHGR